MPFQPRGGVPVVKRITFDTTGRALPGPFATLYLKIRNKGANVARVYFTETDYTDDANYIEIPIAAATDPHGEWEGPVELVPGDSSGRADIYAKGIGGNAVLEIVFFQRRG